LDRFAYSLASSVAGLEISERELEPIENAPFGFGAGNPMDPVEEFPRRDRHRPGQPDQGVDPADPFALLQQADLGPVQRGRPPNAVGALNL
jgi:hypothetical protein